MPHRDVPKSESAVIPQTKFVDFGHEEIFIHDLVLSCIVELELEYVSIGQDFGFVVGDVEGRV
jgi:hypothetical protein